MLPKSLLRTRITSNEIVPLYIKENTLHLNLAQELIEICNDCVNHKMQDLTTQFEEILQSTTRLKLVQSFIHLLEKRFCLSEEHQTLAPLLREKLFTKAAQVNQHDFKNTDWRNNILAELSQELNLKQDQIENLMYADLKSQRIIESFEPLEPEELIQRYNLSLAQTLLFDAEFLDFNCTFESQNASNQLRKLVQSMKFFSLLHEIRQNDDNSYDFRLNGPNALLEQPQKYGLKLAAFLPNLYHFKKWTATALIKTKNTKKKFTLTPDDFNYTPKPLPLTTNDEILTLIKKIQQTSNLWEISTQTPIQKIENQHLWLADFTLTHKISKKTVSVEIIPPWKHPDINKKLMLLKKLPNNLLLVLSQKSKLPPAILKNPPQNLLIYKNTIIPQKLLSAASDLLQNSLPF